MGVRLQATIVLVLGTYVLVSPSDVPAERIAVAGVSAVSARRVCSECGVCYSGHDCPSLSQMTGYCQDLCGNDSTACGFCEDIDPEIPWIECYEEPPQGQQWRKYWWCQFPA
jgi:hypothetical protein